MRDRIPVIFIAVVFLVLVAFLFLRLISSIIERPHKPKPPAKAVVKSSKKRQVTTAKEKSGSEVRVAVVIDDFGYNMNNLDELFSIGLPVTLSVLPGLPYSRRIAKEAGSRGYEVILHLPLEAHGKNVREEANTIKTGMERNRVRAILAEEMASVPGIDGVSNHMGSKATEDEVLMGEIFSYLKENGLYFFDSLTSQKSVCREVAVAAEIRYARRDIFLDNMDDPSYIRKQFESLRRFAVRKGRAIAICHDRKNTISVLCDVMPQMERQGIKFVYLSELVE